MNRFLHQRESRRSRAGFTLIEMLVVVAIIAVLASLALPQLDKAMKKSAQTKSANNLRQIGIGLANYLAENNGTYPMETTSDFKSSYWTQTLLPYLSPARKGGWLDVHNSQIYQSPVLMDPLLKNPQHQSLGDYGCNNAVFVYPGSDPSNPVPPKSQASIGQASSIVTVLSAGITYGGKEAGSWYLEAKYYVYGTATQFPSDRGMNGVLCLFADGHTDIIPRVEFDRNKAALLLPN